MLVCEHMRACLDNIHLRPWDSLFFKTQAKGRVYIVSDKVLPVLTPILLESEKNCFREQVDAPVPIRTLSDIKRQK